MSRVTKILVSVFFIFIVSFVNEVVADKTEKTAGSILTEQFGGMHFSEKRKFNSILDYFITIKLNDRYKIDNNIKINDNTLQEIKETNTRWFNDCIRRYNANILFQKGMYNEVSKINNELGIINQFSIAGPAAEQDTKSNLWYDIKTDRFGVISFNNFSNHNSNNYYKLRTKIKINNSGLYNIVIGKNSTLKLDLNNITIFNNQKNHDFSEDQYIVRIYLPNGEFELDGLCQLSGENDKLTMRLILEEMTPVEKIEVKSAGIIDYADFISKNGADRIESAIIAGLSGLNSQEENEVISAISEYLNKNSKDWLVWYCLELLENDSYKKELYLDKIFNLNNQFRPAWYERIMLDVQRDDFYGAAKNLYNHVNEIEGDPYLTKFEGYISVKFNDIERLKKSINFLKVRNYNYWVEELTLYDSEKSNDIIGINSSLKKIITKYPSTKNDELNYLNILIKNGDYQSALNQCMKLKGKYPDDSSIKISCAKILRSTGKISDAIVELSAARVSAQNNSDILYELGECYNTLGKIDLAIYYWRECIRINPQDSELVKRILLLDKRSLSINRNISSELYDYSDLMKRSENNKDEDAVLLDYKYELRVLSDGSTEKHVRKIYQCLNEDSLNNLQKQYVVYNPANEEIQDFSCRVINKGQIDTVTDFYQYSLSNPESSLYYDALAYYAVLSNLQVNSIIDFSYTIHSRNDTAFKGYFGEKIVIADEYPVCGGEIKIILPAESKIQLYERNFGEEKIKKSIDDHNQIYSVVFTNVSGYSDEKGRPNISEKAPSIYLTNMKSWDDFYKWYSKLIQERIIVSSEMKDFIRETISDNDSDEIKVKKIYEKLTDKIRYVGFEMGIGGIKPRATDVTFNTKMGDCKDIALLLVALYRESGIKADLALVRTNDKGMVYKEVPFAGEFNHAICYVEIDNGIFLDGTVRYNGYRELPDGDKNCEALIIGLDKATFITSVSGPYITNYTDANSEVIINKNGDGRINRRISKTGDMAVEVRPVISRKDEFYKYLASYWNERYKGASIFNIESSLPAKNEKLEYGYSIEIPAYIDLHNDYAIITALLQTQNPFIQYCYSEKRINPILIQDQSSMSNHVMYILPEGYSFQTKNIADKIENKWFKVTLKIESQSLTKCQIDYSLEIFNSRILPEEYQDFKSEVAKLTALINTRMVIKKNVN